MDRHGALEASWRALGAAHAADADRARQQVNCSPSPRGEAKLAGRAVFFDGRFEDWSPFCAGVVGRRIKPRVLGRTPREIELAASALVPGGTVAIARTEVVSWGRESVCPRALGNG